MKFKGKQGVKACRVWSSVNHNHCDCDYVIMIL